MFEVIKETNPYGSVDDILKIENTESTQIEYTFGDILTIDNEYTFSLWVRSTGATKTSVHISNQTGEFNLTSEWRRIKFTAQSNIATSKEVYFSIAPNTILYCYEGQLESGNVATDFKLNPADLMASIDEVNSSLSVLQTDFKVEQGKIETLIKDTTIDGTKLKDKYLQTVETVDGMKTTINSLETDIDGLTSKTTTIETSVDGIKTQVSSAVSKADQANNRVDDLEERADSGEFDGKGVQGTPTTVYQAGTSATNPPSGTWSSTIPTVTAGQYLWSKTTITYTDGTSTPIYSVVRSPKDGEKGQAGDKGETGDTGKGISSIVHHYLASSSASGVTTSTSGWSTSPQSVTSSKKYLWYYQTINYTTGSPTNTTPAIIGVYGDTGGKGADGKGIKSVQPQYYLSSSNTTQIGGSWSSTQPAWVKGKYYWTRDHITWSDNSTSDTTPVLATALNNANQVANEAQTIAEQTSDKFTWIVKSGSNETNFTLTDRTAQLVADNINLNGLVTFNGLNAETQDKLNKVVGTNLFKNTKDFGDPTDNEGFGSYDIVDEKYGQFTVRGKDSITSTMASTFVTRWTDFNYGDEFTFSFYAKGNLDHMVCFFYGGTGYVKAKVIASSNNMEGGYSDGKCDFGKLTSEWKRYWVAWKVDSTGDLSIYKTVLIRSDGSQLGQSVYVCGLKFERGRTPTDWSPAPEDKADQSTIDAWGSSTIEDDVTQINGGYIQTNTIKAEQLNVENIFASGSAAMNIINAQEINANRITSGTIKANYLELYGLAVLQKETNLVTLSIDSEGNTTMRGTVESYNYNAGKTGWSIKNTGDAEFNDVTVRGSVITNDGGIVSSGGSGRNLLINSSLLYSSLPENTNFTLYTVNNIASSQLTNDGLHYTATADNGAINSSRGIRVNLREFNINVGDTISFSCDVKGNFGTSNNGLTIMHATTTNDAFYALVSAGNKYPTTIRNWERKSRTYTIPSNIKVESNGDCYIYFFFGGGYGSEVDVYVRNLKLEEGNITTAWSPAPEDTLKQVRFWAGSSYENREVAPFIVYNDGSVRATRGEFGGVFSGTVEIGNITIEDPSKTAGGDALLTIQNGQNGVKRIQLKDSESSTFAQNLIISDNQYNSKITLNQDGSGTFTSGVYIGDSSTSLLANQLNLEGNILSSDSGGFYFDSSKVSIGTTSHNSLLNVRGNIESSGSITLDGTLSFGDVVTFKPLSNGLDINVLK